MPQPSHIADRLPCPFLPEAAQALRPSDIRTLRAQGGASAYHANLTCAQSLWLQGLSAQSLLQLNHALAVDLSHDTSILTRWPLPYQAKVWLFQNCPADEFIGNPVRHYQHLATRVSGALQEIRSWRAWACFHLAERNLPSITFPRDERQIAQEQLVIPSWQKTLDQIQTLTSSHEKELLRSL